MSRVSRFNNLDKDPHWGVFNAKIIKIDKYDVLLQDIFSNYQIRVPFNLKPISAVTKAGKDIWINQLGEIGYGSERELLESFKRFPKSEEEKKFYPACEGEVHLFNFLKALHCPNPFDSSKSIHPGNTKHIHDPYYFRQLFLSENPNLTIGGILYVDSDFNERLFPKFVPAHKVSLLRNCKGNFETIQNDYQLKEVISLLTSNFKPQGHYHWGQIESFTIPDLKKDYDVTEI